MTILLALPSYPSYYLNHTSFLHSLLLPFCWLLNSLPHFPVTLTMSIYALTARIPSAIPTFTIKPSIMKLRRSEFASHAIAKFIDAYDMSIECL